MQISMADERCEVIGCDAPAERSLPYSRVSPYLDVGGAPRKKGHAGRRHVRLCRSHYREYKKKSKKDRELERLSWT